MGKKLAALPLAVLTLAGTASAGRMAVGLKTPFVFEMLNESNFWDYKTTESWIGGLGTLELSALPTLGVEFGVGYLAGLGGKLENGTEMEWKTNIIPIEILLKYYPPMAKGSKMHPYIGTGARISIESISEKYGDDYQDAGSMTRIYFPNPVIAGGLEFDVSPNMRLGGAISFRTFSESYSPPEGTTGDQTLISSHTGLGLVLKYMF